VMVVEPVSRIDDVAVILDKTGHPCMPRGSRGVVTCRFHWLTGTRLQ
jgi:hypothetical protein